MSNQASNTAASGPPWELYSGRQRAVFLLILFLACTSNYVDRQLMSVLIEPIKQEFGASDTQMGLLTGFAFALFYAVLGIPVAWIADRGDRRMVISISMALWSVMTALCGVANNFWQMFLARMGVGIGEAGAIPPAQSLIADYFPPEQRTRALAIFMSAATVGYLVAFMGGAKIAAAYDWRTAFIVMGLPGVLLALISWFGLKEPRLLPGRAIVRSDAEPFAQTLRALFAKRSYLLVTIAGTLYFLVAYGALVWIPPYLQRVLGLELAAVGTSYGIVSAVGTVVGTLVGGAVTDRLIKRDRRWASWTPGIALLLAWPLYTAALLVDSYPLFLAFTLFGLMLIAAAVPAMFGLIHLVCGSGRRAMAVAINFFFANLIGLGLGPVVTGILSDTFTAAHGVVGLRYALLIALTMIIPSGLAYLAISRHLLRDTEA